MYFYPRSPCGERRADFAVIAEVIAISIHALLAESDSFGFGGDTELGDFYPRSPCGERLLHGVEFDSDIKFLSTLSLRRAT